MSDEMTARLRKDAEDVVDGPIELDCLWHDEAQFEAFLAWLVAIVEREVGLVPA